MFSNNSVTTYELAKDTFAVCEMQAVSETTAIMSLLQLLDEALRQVRWMLFQPRELEALRRILAVLLTLFKMWIYCWNGAPQPLS
jgi:hypothetical protein